LAERTAPFLRAAEMLESGPWRDRLNAAAMLELSKTRDQAEGDASDETVEFMRANVENIRTMEQVQPFSPPGVRNHVEYRPLEGFVFAVSPFNFVSTNNLAFGPAVLGNTVVWKPAESASLVAHLSLQVLREAGLPDGVVNLVHGSGAELGPHVLMHQDLAAVHFTGSTATFRRIFRTVGENVDGYRNYPRVVGETGGKDFVIAHPSADVDALAAACVRGAYEYQGQKCAAPSRLYIPRSLWPALRERLVELTRRVVVGDPTLPRTHIGAVINARQHAKHTEALTRARAEGLVVVGGTTDDCTGWFVDPTVLQVADPHSPFMTEELFAPVMAAYVYEDADWAETLRLVDESTIYGLTGAVFAQDEQAIVQAGEALRYTAGNFYINDKPSGAVVGQQPFGGARASGTNDKTGTVWNLIRFASPRSVKRNDTTITTWPTRSSYQAGEMRSDIVVIGGGAVGAAVAYFAKVLDPSVGVTVIERDPRYERASTPRASGGVRRLFSLPENIELSKYSIGFFEDFTETMAVDGVEADIGFKKNGYLFIVPPSDRDMLKENFDTQQGLGCNVVWLEPDELKQKFPSMNVEDLGCAVYSPDDGWLDPHSVLMGLRNKAKSLGANFVADEVVGMVRESNTVTAALLKSGRRIEADQFVNAAGAWAKDVCAMLGFKVPIEPLRRFEHYFESQEPIEPLPYLKDTQRLAFRPEGGGYSGGVPTLEEPRGYNFDVDRSYFENAVWPALAHRFPQFERTRCVNTLPGLYDQNDFDGNVIIGPGADGLGNFHLVAGFSGHGLMHAPGCGRAVAELVLTGQYQTIDLTRFGWQRVLDGAPLPEQGII
jgi:delta-1-pyrroline-5-carboxylate dehydrogenase group 1